MGYHDSKGMEPYFTFTGRTINNLTYHMFADLLVYLYEKITTHILCILFRSSSENANLSPKDCFQFLTAATQTFRMEYINRQKLAQEEIERRYN